MGSATPRKILLVDDTPLFIELEKRLLEGRGYQMESALSASEALLKATVFQPDLVILDQQMPEMDGVECCRLMKSEPSLRAIPVILVTESREREDVRRALESGCDDFVVKPITDMVLIQKVEAVFDPARRRRSPRMPASIATEYTDFETVDQGVAREIGRGGMLLRGPRVVPTDSRIQLAFTLPEPFDRKRIQVFGRIAYHRAGDGSETDMGVEFIALDRESELLIDAMVRGILEMPGRAPSILAPDRAEPPKPGEVGKRMEEILDELYRLESEKRNLVREYHDLETRYQELELENIELARKVLESENENATLASLYVASYQLHMSLDFGSVLDTITQILVSLIGVDSFALLFMSEDRSRLTPGLCYGLPEGWSPALSLAEGPTATAVRGLKPYVREGDVEAPPGEPIAVVPLAIREDLLGLIAVYHVVGHKKGFSKLDEKLFQLLSHHAATAIYCSKAYSESERKRRTFQEFIKMLTRQ